MTDWTTFHCKYRTDTAKARQQKRCRVYYKQGVWKATRWLSLPQCPSQPGIHLEDCYKAYHMTRRSAVVAVMWPDNITTNIHKQINK